MKDNSCNSISYIFERNLRQEEGRNRGIFNEWVYLHCSSTGLLQNSNRWREKVNPNKSRNSLQLLTDSNRGVCVCVCDEWARASVSFSGKPKETTRDIPQFLLSPHIQNRFDNGQARAQHRSAADRTARQAENKYATKIRKENCDIVHLSIFYLYYCCHSHSIVSIDRYTYS